MVCSFSYDDEVGWEGEGANSMLSDDEMLLEELQCLEHMNELEIAVQSLAGLEKLFNTRKLQENTRQLAVGRFYGQKCIDVSFLANTNCLEAFQIASCDMEELVVDTTGNGLHKSATRTDRSFNNITSMSARWCHKLEHLTCLVLMPNLRTLYVENCEALKEIINEEKLDEVVGKGQILQPFSNLTMIPFLNLPELESIYRRGTLP